MYRSSEIETLARRLVKQRTLLSAAWSLQRADHGEQPYWMLITLAAMIGQVGLPGAGFGFGYGAEGFVGSSWRRFNWATLSKGRNPTGFAIPVARITDMLLNPGKTISYDGQQITYPDTKLVYWAGGNPFHHHQDLNQLAKAWRKPDTVIVNEPWWTPTAQWADIVFPATTALEREDLCASSHDPYALVMEKVIDPMHDARSDHEIFKGLAEQLGLLETFSEGRNEQDWLRHMWEKSSTSAQKQGFELPSYDAFRNDKSYKMPPPDVRKVWLSDFRRDPSNHPLATPSGKIELYSETIAAYEYDDCPPHASWLEPYERLGGAVSERYPLHLMSPQPARRLHSQLDHSKYSQDGKIQGKEVLYMNSTDATARGIKPGDIVRIYNDRGTTLAGVAVDDNLMDNVVMLPTGAWFNPSQRLVLDNNAPELNGNPNVLTRDKGTSSLAQGPSSSTCLVEVEVYGE